MPIIVVFFGGGIGSVARYLLSLGIMSLWNGAFPLGTLLINLIGCFLIGFLGGLSEKFLIDSNLRLALQTGFLGGFTTFSSFGLETFQLIRSGENIQAGINMLVSNLVGVVLVVVGFAVSTLIFRTSSKE